MDEFERAMMMLDVKPDQPAKKKAKGDAPAMEVVEDIDFEAAMRALPDGKPPKVAPAKKEARADAGAGERARVEAEARAVRYAATEEEAAEFMAAMGNVQTPRVVESTTKVVGSPDVEALTRRIGRGQLEPDATLDLHGKNKQQALDRLTRFIAEARADKWRVVRVIVGKGLHSEGGDPVVGPAVERFLRDGPALEVMRAPAHLGGGGALIAILRLE